MKIKKASVQAMAIKFSFCFVSLVFIGACAYEDEDTGDAALSAPVAQHKMFSASVLPLDGPNKYAVALEWPAEMRSAAFFFQRTGGTEGSKVFETLDFATTRSTVAVSEVGISYDFTLCSRDGTSITTIEKQTVQIPKDIEAASYAEIVNLTGIGRLYLKEGSKFLTLGEPLKIEVEEIVAPNATIATFEETQAAGANAAGRAAAEIIIQAKRATGKLTILARGEHGGEGSEGTAGPNGLPGTAGAPGTWKMNPEQVTRGRQFQSAVDAMERSIKHHHPPFHSLDWTFNYTGNSGIPWTICDRAPTNGTAGGNGIPGNDGNSGGNGGNSPPVHVTIANQSNFLVDISAAPGLGGIGGHGGKGGEGGPGGPPGALDEGHRCPPASAGPAGAKAKDGRQGRSGDTGAKGDVCFRNGTLVQGMCKD